MAVRRKLPQYPNRSARSPSAIEVFTKYFPLFLASLTKEKSLDAIRRLSSDTAELADVFASQALTASHDERPRCMAGCSWCCNMKVTLYPPDLLRIVEFLRTSLNTDEFAALTKRVREMDAVTHGLHSDDRLAAKMPCPLLVNGCCSVYQVRPLTCRAWNSLDETACRSAAEDYIYTPITPNAVQRDLVLAVSSAVGEALKEVGMGGEGLELNAALRLAFERSGVFDRWLAGYHPWTSAIDREVPDNGPDE